MKKIVDFFKKYKYLLGVLVLGVLVRLIGLTYGYPYVLSIDEPAIIRSSLGIRFNVFIDHFDWPHLNFYIHFFLFEIFIKFRGLIQILNLRSPVESVFPILWNDPFIFYLLARLLSTFFVVFSCIPIYLVLKKLMPEKYALGGLLAFLMIPYVLSMSKIAIQEPAQIFFIAWAIYFVFRIFEKGYLVKDFIWFGFFIGLATGIKYNAGIFGFIPLFIYLSKENIEFNKFLKFSYKLIFAAFVSLFVFISTTFSLIKDWDIFWSDKTGRGLLWQFNDNVDPLPIQGHMHKLVENVVSLSSELSVGLFGVLIFVLLLNIYLYFRKSIKKNDLFRFNFVFSIFFIVYFVYVSRYGRSGGRYFFPIYVFLPFFFSYFLYLVDNKFNKYIGKALLVGIALLTLSSIVKTQERFFYPSPQTEAIVHVKENFSDRDIYIKGEDLRNINVVNNLNFKIYKEDSRIKQNDIVISEEILNDNSFDLLKSYKNINIYVKNQ